MLKMHWPVTCPKATSILRKRCFFWCKVDGKRMSVAVGTDRRRQGEQRSGQRRKRNELKKSADDKRPLGPKRRHCASREMSRSIVWLVLRSPNA